MICYLEADDFGAAYSLEFSNVLRILRSYFHDFRISLFTVPMEFDPIVLSMLDHPAVELCVHGFRHQHNESVSEDILEFLPMVGFEKIYRAPYHQLSNHMYNLLEKFDYQIMLNPEDQEDTRKGVRWNWNIKDEPDLTKKMLHGHGHVQDTQGNGLNRSLERIKMLPPNTQFKFLSQMHE